MTIGVVITDFMGIKELYKSITRDEWKFWAKVLAVILIITSFSRVLAFLIAPAEYEWRGNVIFSHVDRYVYISYIEQAREGRYLFHDLYTAKEESVPMLNIFWLGAGLLARATGASANFILEFLRILFIPLLLFVLYLFIGYFINDTKQKKLAFVLSSLAGGLGVVFLPLIALFFNEKAMSYNLPIDLDTAEAFIFLINYYSAHFIFSASLFFGIMLLTLLSIDGKKIWYAFPAGLMSLVLANFHPFTLIILFFIFFAYFLSLIWADRKNALFLFKYALILGTITLPSIAYHISMFNTPWWQNQTWKSTTYTPSIASVVSGYGLLLLFAVRTLYFSYRNKISVRHEKFLLVWFFAQSAMFFLPVSVQRRFFEGYAVCLAILASYSLVIFLEKRPWITRGRIFVTSAFIVLFCTSFLLVIFLDLKNVFIRGNVMYVPKDAFRAMNVLRMLSEEDDLVISDIYNSAMIPGRALRRVFVGHGTETINFDEKYNILTAFMKSTDAEERRAILENNKIKFLFYDKQWASDWVWNPDDDPSLERIYFKGNYAVYKFRF